MFLRVTTQAKKKKKKEHICVDDAIFINTGHITLLYQHLMGM